MGGEWEFGLVLLGWAAAGVLSRFDSLPAVAGLCDNLDVGAAERIARTPARIIASSSASSTLIIGPTMTPRQLPLRGCAAVDLAACRDLGPVIFDEQMQDRGAWWPELTKWRRHLLACGRG
jgi:hypothetical protein